MSITIIAIPYTISALVTTLTAASATAAILTAASDFIATAVMENKQDCNENCCDDVHIISEANFLEKKVDTVFTDKNILLKTLEEHGVQNIKEEFGIIKGEIESFHFTFEKNNINNCYCVTVNYQDKSNIEEKIKDLTSEYVSNVQEQSYLEILENLKQNNMKIDEEDVLEDNTIVLTINLED